MQIKQFITDVKDISKTRKFWTGAAGFVLLYLSENYADRAWVQGTIAVATLFGIWRTPNKDTTRD